jgi:20S proteasome alpha/beta subunit
MKVGSKVSIIGVEDSKGTLFQIDPDGVAIVETKTKMILCLAKELIEL